MVDRHTMCPIYWAYDSRSNKLIGQNQIDIPYFLNEYFFCILYLLSIVGLFFFSFEIFLILISLDHIRLTLMGITPWLGHDCGWGCITYKPTILEIFTNISAQIFFQVIKRITNGGADYSFECIGDTGTVTTALKSCCDVNSLSSLFHQRIKFLHARISTLKLDAVLLPFYSYIGLGFDCYSWCTKDEARDNSSLWITS